MLSEQKQPWEVLILGVDFDVGDNLATGESISVGSSEVKVYDSVGGLDDTGMLVAGSVAVSGDTILQATIQGGVSGQRYKVSFRAWISATKQLEDDLILIVGD